MEISDIMLKEAKYIVVKELDCFGDSVENIYLFNTMTIHYNMAQKMTNDRLGLVVGAGFIKFMDDGPVCYGESVSLRIKSRPDKDTNLAKKAFGEDY